MDSLSLFLTDKCICRGLTENERHFLGCENLTFFGLLNGRGQFLVYNTSSLLGIIFPIKVPIMGITDYVIWRKLPHLSGLPLLIYRIEKKKDGGQLVSKESVPYCMSGHRQRVWIRACNNDLVS